MEFIHRNEAKWQKAWAKDRIFEADPKSGQKKYFITFPYSYANGPLHVGHAFTATRVDAYARFKRMLGYNVLFPWAWHWTGTSITGASERVKLGDKAFIRALQDIDGVPQEKLNRFTDPVYMASYYTGENRKTVHLAGFSIDWRREFQTTSPLFSKFIEWQYESLRKKGYVVRGTHPVVWCPRCESPTGDADRHEGEGVSQEEYILLKFKYNGVCLPAATLRPETIYGVTNIWVHPDSEYVEVKVDGEKWVVSEAAAKKLKDQKEVTILRHFKGAEIIGGEATNPLNKKKLPILPAIFVNPDNATGIVYSVPAHAPIDWLALKDLKKNPIHLKDFNIKPTVVEKITPISIIRTEGFEEYPAVEVVEKLDVKDQCDPKAEEATKLLYKKEFHSGYLKEICGEYAGKAVREVKEVLVKTFVKLGFADVMYDLPQPIICRCLTPCTVKVLKEQWFLKYSDKEWKELTKKTLNRAAIYPETARAWFLTIIDWLKDWPCARKSGLGTPLPWNKEWIIETLSDSTVYMAFYTISKQIREHKISPEQMTNEIFDYIFYGKGNLKDLARLTQLKPQILRSMREEFMYWYPVDMRNSAKELIPNHLTFYLFHHVALFPPEQQPLAIGANGMLTIKGKKMSKSKGNFVTFRSALQKHGADPTRFELLLRAEDMDDPEWRDEDGEKAKIKLESFNRLVDTIIQNTKDNNVGVIEKWLFSVIQRRIENITHNMEIFKTRTSIENAFFGVWNDLRWYIRRKGNMNATALLDVLTVWVRLLTPFIPHLCEEIWSKIGDGNFVSLSEWPKYDQTKIDHTTELHEALIRSTIDDTHNIIRAIKITPKRICYYTSAPWKWKIYKRALQFSLRKGQITQSELMRELMKNSEMKRKPNEVARFIQQILNEINQMAQSKRENLFLAETLDETSVLKEAEAFLRRELNSQVEIYMEKSDQRYDPQNRAHLANPYRPAIYVE